MLQTILRGEVFSQKFSNKTLLDFKVRIYKNIKKKQK